MYYLKIKNSRTDSIEIIFEKLSKLQGLIEYLEDNDVIMKYEIYTDEYLAANKGNE